MRYLLCFGAVALLADLASSQAARPAAKGWVQPRTPDGQPDIQGLWTNATLTPMERPRELGSKEYFTEQEAAEYEARRIEQTNVDRPQARREGDPGAYNNFWFDRGTRVVKSRRTSLVVDPPDGRLPPMTPAAKAIWDRVHAPFDRLPSDGPEDRLLTERCILFGGAGPPMLPEPYNNNYQIVQNRAYVAILMELNHDTRVIPLDSRPPLAANIRQWKGDSHGRWEGATLVVETTNFRHNHRSRFGVAYLDGMSDENLRVRERFTRTDPDTIIYRATVEDPTVYTRPWTVELSMSRRAEPMYEFACHEGNYGMFGILAGARAEERKAAGR